MKNNEREQYEALLTEESDLENPQQRLINKPSSSFWDLDKKLVLILLLSLSNFIFFTLWILQSTQCHYPDAQILYSPVRDILEYEVITFNATDGRNRHPDPWSQPLSDELDEAWEGLYNDFGISEVPESIARQLANRTDLIPSNVTADGVYRITLDVFHQLHCLNTIRKALHPERYPNVTRHHQDHCINSLRQSLQCHSDVSTLVFQEMEDTGDIEPRFNIAHSCRNFRKLQEWALEHKARD
ncbi:hypothetical protein Moror_10940 [Moniliophthora roreri MCA 2997]|uniref:Tat pathway signal sequence n=1 Tax=Moniliophthora roreri (strain MCA 2997) TaxID=1381753 RepID=V2WIP8_MONRO|nr:hypothetical protein Moror_10940 [Moniliophthora roreri MCA 2997]KAI3615622.1 hypothetical protein WG66_011940 [Moniliophthora roreri]